MSSDYTGGCLCGAVRYRATAEPLVVTHCHCSLCRKSSGAPFLTWIAFPEDAFTFTKGEPTIYRATDKAERGFCPKCGTQIIFRHVESTRKVDVTLGSLDEPDAVRPVDHIWVSSKVEWLHIEDGLPRHHGERGDA